MTAAASYYGGDAFTSGLRWLVLALGVLAALVLAWRCLRVVFPPRGPRAWRGRMHSAGRHNRRVGR